MKAKLFVLVVALQTAWVVATVAVQEYGLRRGAVVLLETAPVDPRDLLRGDYVILNYPISTVPMGVFAEGITNQPPDGTPIFVRLEQRGRFHEIETASLTSMESEKDHPVLKGKVSSSWFWSGLDGTNATVRVEYGLERFYVREGTGNPTGKLTVEAAIPPSGNAVIKQVYLDGKPYAEAMAEHGR
jgi:uncharacterized membrane-anchored protein